jgi:hypothetical protein
MEHKSIVRRVVKKTVYNDRIIALKLKAEPVSILIMQVYLPTSEYEDDEVENFYDTLEEIGGNGMALLEMSQIGTLLDQTD